ncbi:hypothetical protein Pla163_20100 [Planctomycetes bacterium Pla163]|uniref:Uncharacterized protein n=1 Tax=Rohdeia mirabilis TaxID=2528008 RepID=A0A518D088_9BACT|nr:hypothetical protein Pla163_20100 [Planctomycetes bacterium Pla163]
MSDSDDEPSFLRENWPWILLPALVVLAVVAYFVLSSGGGGDFQYGDF